MINTLLQGLRQIRPRSEAERYTRGEADITEVLEALDLRLSELRRELDAPQAGRLRDEPGEVTAPF